MAYTILNDHDLSQLLTVADVIPAIEDTLRAQVAGGLVAPPRFRVAADHGALVFTAGAESAYQQVIGFRVYDTFPDDQPGHEQITAVFDSTTGIFKGAVIGNTLGAIRTAAINAAAIKALARPDARVLGIIGTGFQARYHVAGAAAVRPFERALIYSRTAAHRTAFAAEMRDRCPFEVAAVDSAEAVVGAADVLLCLTNAQQPVFNADWLRPGTHINTIGPKSVGGHEVPIAAAAKSRIIATDSLAQVDAYARPFFLRDTPHRARMIELGALLAGLTAGRSAAEDITLFCSAGLAGTEVVVANVALQRAASEK